MKRIACMLCALVMLAVMCPFASAEGGSAAPKVTISITDSSGNDISAVGLETGDTFWAEFGLENYDGVLGDYTDEDVYDRVIACIILALNYDSTKVAPVTNGGVLVWDTPYMDIHTGGSLRTADTAGGMRLLLQTDSSGGQDFCIDRSTLDLLGGVLFAVQFTVTADTDGLTDSYAALSLTAESACGITVNTRQENASLITTDNVAGLTYGSKQVAIGTVGGGTPAYIAGDVNGDDEVTDRDAVHLLYHTFLPDLYPVNQDCDFNGDGEVTDRDAVYLLYYTFLPDLYPIG